MTFASTPSLRADPELRHATEAALREGENLSSFMEQSLRDQAISHKLHDEFVSRGLVSRDEARRTGEYFDAASLHAELCSMLTKWSGGNVSR
ncbi:MAG: YlcI/YnfO family protein [Acidobacteriaceae bacterium]